MARRGAVGAGSDVAGPGHGQSAPRTVGRRGGACLDARRFAGGDHRGGGLTPRSSRIAGRAWWGAAARTERKMARAHPAFAPPPLRAWQMGEFVAASLPWPYTGGPACMPGRWRLAEGWGGGL